MNRDIPDLFSGCFDGAHQQMGPEKFKQTFCAVCQNPGCRNSLTGQSRWMMRMLTQEDRLLHNPNLVERDLGLPDFQDALSQALAMEISNRKGDWEIPTQAEVAVAAMELITGKPSGFQELPPPPPLLPQVAPPPPPPPPPVVPPQNENKETWIVKGDKGSEYEVSLSGKTSWSCSCPSFKFNGDCKHVHDMKVKLSRAPENIRQEAPPPPSNHMPQVSMGRPAPFLPPSTNTHFPSAGVMVGGGEPEPAPSPSAQPDPWAVPETKVKVGARVIVGGGAKR